MQGTYEKSAHMMTTVLLLLPSSAECVRIVSSRRAPQSPRSVLHRLRYIYIYYIFVRMRCVVYRRRLGARSDIVWNPRGVYTRRRPFIV